MSFNYNGTNPTAITYNGTSLNVLKYNSTNVWGKPFSLSITQGANTTVTVNRTSSPNQHASTGNISSGSLVYYDDVLQVSVSVGSGYTLQSFTLNGSAWTSGNSHTVSGNVTVVSSAVASASWQTVWTGTISFRTRSTTYDNVSNSSFTNIVYGRPTRVSGTGYYQNKGIFTNFEIPTSSSTNTILVNDGIDQRIFGLLTNNTIQVSIKGTALYYHGIILKEVQQYF